MRGRAVRKALMPVAVPVVEPVVEPVDDLPEEFGDPEEVNVWKKILPGVDATVPIPGTLEFSAAEAKRGAQKILDEIQEFSKTAEAREEKIAAVRERFLARKRQKIG